MNAQALTSVLWSIDQSLPGGVIPWIFIVFISILAISGFIASKSGEL